MQQFLQRLLTQRPVILQLLRFGAIGVLNTTLDFIILNIIAKTLGIESGTRLGVINIIGFCAALIQSYYWNKYWTFGSSVNTDLVKNFWRLVVVGIIGAVGFIAVIIGARAGATPAYYLIILGLFLAAEAGAWMAYGLTRGMVVSQDRRQVIGFVIVSVIGLIINSIIVSFTSNSLSNVSVLKSNADLLKNVAKVLATGVSLIWNFVGYKLFVFKK